MVDRSSKWRFPFFLIWGGQAISLFGSAIVQFALVWWLTQRTAPAMTFLPLLVIGHIILTGFWLKAPAGRRLDESGKV